MMGNSKLKRALLFINEVIIYKIIIQLTVSNRFIKNESA